MEFTKLELGSSHEFWIKIKHEYPAQFKRALLFLFLFTTTYLCETGFSVMLTIKSELRNDPSMRLKLSITGPNISTLITTMQIHPISLIL